MSLGNVPGMKCLHKNRRWQEGTRLLPGSRLKPSIHSRSQAGPVGQVKNLDLGHAPGYGPGGANIRGEEIQSARNRLGKGQTERFLV